MTAPALPPLGWIWWLCERRGPDGALWPLLIPAATADDAEAALAEQCGEGEVLGRYLGSAPAPD